MFAEREREERRRLLMMQPKRASSRIERKRQDQEEKDRLLALKVRRKVSAIAPLSSSKLLPLYTLGRRKSVILEG
jgi:hypothetical protein